MKMTIRQYKTTFSFYNKLVIVLVSVIFALLLASCENNYKQSIATNRAASIFPEYYGSTLPPNIAPLNFIIKEPGSKFRVEIIGENGKPIIISQSSPKIKIPIKDWHKLLNANIGGTINIDILSFDDKKWSTSLPISAMKKN
jgi:hypothetical protein